MEETDQEEALRNLLMENEEGSKKHTDEPSFHFLVLKAGLQKVNKEKIYAIIHDISKNSRYYGKLMERKDKIKQSISEKKEKIEKFRKDPQEIDRVNFIIQKKIETIEKERDLSRTWVHIDLDMFFAACEIRDNPELKDKPVAVGGMMYINSANYIARQYGITSIMPGFIAKKLCPDLIFIDVNKQKYKETASCFKNLIVEYDPYFESGGLDEALLDITDYLNKHGSHSSSEIEKVCHDMRMKINEVTGITCSCGIAPNKMLAKLCTEINKPNGQYYMKPVKEKILAFLERLPVRKVPGIGNSYEQVLNGLGINTCKDLLHHLSDLFVAFTEHTFDFFLSAAFGVSRSLHIPPEARKSVSICRTFPTIDNQTDIENKIKEIAVLLSEELQSLKKKAKHFTLIIKTHNFDITNRGGPIDKYIDDSVGINKFALKLLHDLLPVEPLRSIMIRAIQLIDNNNLQTLETFFNKMNSSLEKNHYQKDFTLTSEELEQFDPDPEFDKSFSHIPEEFDSRELSENIASSTIFQESQESNNSINEQLSHSQENILLEKSSHIICPICNFKFESTVNKTRINNHIDKCLLEVETMNSDKMLDGNSGSQSLASKVTKEEDMRKDKNLTKKRLLEGPNQAKPGNKLKQAKKYPIETKDIRKLEDFFCKK